MVMMMMKAPNQMTRVMVMTTVSKSMTMVVLLMTASKYMMMVMVLMMTQQVATKIMRLVNKARCVDNNKSYQKKASARRQLTTLVRLRNKEKGLPKGVLSGG